MPDSSDLHHTILHHLVEQGYAPTSAELAALFGVDAREIAHSLAVLQQQHGVVLHPHAPEVWVIHPFSTAPTPFAVRHGKRLWWGNCAWCSLGIAALLGGDGILIQTTLGAEGEPVALHVDHGHVTEDLWVHFPVPMSHAWDNVIYTCSTMLLFESENQIDDWAARHAIPRGDSQPVQRVYEFASAWYGRHLDPEWRKWTTEEARSMFLRFGLTGPTWDLPATGQRF